MVFRWFNTKIIVQVILILITCFLFVWSIHQEYLLVARFTFGCFIIFQVVLLIKFVQNSNNKLLYFLELIKNQGLMERFQQIENENSLHKINQIYNEIIDLISAAKIEKEIEHQYFQYILEIIGTCVLSYKQDGRVEIFNNAAQKLLQIKKINKIDEFNNQYPVFFTLIKNIQDNEQKLCRIKVGSNLLVLSVLCSKFKVRGTIVNVLSFQNIKAELENEELDAYQKLIAVLRHEIMNSITPINSLTETIINTLSENQTPKSLDHLTNGDIERIFHSISSIDKRNKGLLKFVDSYRSLTKTITPVFERFEIINLFASIQILMNDEFKKEKIQFIYRIEPESLELLADEKLLSQVIINLIRNSIEALRDKNNNKIIEIHASRNNTNAIIIRIIDNGIGISSDNLDKIFIPFFTTRENGSGIGLSICKQIIRMHNANISVESEPNIKTVFTIEF